MWTNPYEQQFGRRSYSCDDALQVKYSRSQTHAQASNSSLVIDLTFVISTYLFAIEISVYQASVLVVDLTISQGDSEVADSTDGLGSAGLALA